MFTTFDLLKIMKGYLPSASSPTHIEVPSCLDISDNFIVDSKCGVVTDPESVLTSGLWSGSNTTSILTEGMLTGDPCLSEYPPLFCPSLPVIKVNHGPITKGDGTATLAALEDVEVKVNGTVVPLLDMNAVQGLLVVDAQMYPSDEVTVSYHYTPNPFVPMEANNPAFALNQYEYPYYSRFPFDSGFWTDTREQPKQVGFHYRAWERAYSTISNDPTSLIFNEPVHSISGDPFSRLISPVLERFDLDNVEGWEIESPTFEQGLLVLEDKVGGKDSVEGSTKFVSKVQDLDFSHTSLTHFRLQITQYEPDGVYTGISIGYAGSTRMHAISFLDVEGFQCAGFLTERGSADTLASYDGIPMTRKSRLEDGTIKYDVLVSAYLPNIKKGHQLLVGGQGVVEVLDVYEEGLAYHLKVDTDILLDNVQVFPSVSYNSLKAYRFFKNETKDLFFFMDGSPQPLASTVESSLATHTSVFEEVFPNQLFFGSLSRRAKSLSKWGNVSFSIFPRSQVDSSQRIFVDPKFEVLPENENQPWIKLEDQGAVSLYQSNLILEQAGRPSGGGLTYARIEPFLKQGSITHLETRLRVDSGSSPLSAFVSVVDDKKDLTLALITDKDSTSSIIFSGTQSFADEGWASNIEDSNTSFHDHFMRIDHGNAIQEAMFDLPSVSDFVFSARIRISLEGNTAAPIHLGVDDGSRQISLLFLRDDITGQELIGFGDREAGSILANTVLHSWSQGFHTYRIVKSENNYSFFIDGAYKTLIADTDLQVSGGSSFQGFLTLTGTVTLDIDHILAHEKGYSDSRIGLWSGNAKDNVNHYITHPATFMGSFITLRAYKDVGSLVNIFLNEDLVLSVPYEDLPDREPHPQLLTNLGYVAFGNPFAGGQATSIWDYLKYDIHELRPPEALANPHAVVSRANVITSPEPALETKPVSLPYVYEGKPIRLSDTGYRAKTFLSVSNPDGSIRYDHEWDDGVIEVDAPHGNVLLNFLPSRPPTESYLRSLFPHTRLNEGTPLYPKSQSVDLKVLSEAITSLEGSNTEISYTVGGELKLTYTRDDSDLYESLDIWEAEEGSLDLIATATDELGFRELEIGMYSDTHVPSVGETSLGHYAPRFRLGEISSVLGQGSLLLMPRSTSKVNFTFEEKFYEIAPPAYGSIECAIMISYPQSFMAGISDVLLAGTQRVLGNYSGVLVPTPFQQCPITHYLKAHIEGKGYLDAALTSSSYLNPDQIEGFGHVNGILRRTDILDTEEILGNGFLDILNIKSLLTVEMQTYSGTSSPMISDPFIIRSPSYILQFGGFSPDPEPSPPSEGNNANRNDSIFEGGEGDPEGGGEGSSSGTYVVGSGELVTDISSGSDYRLATYDDGSLQSWGNGEFGKLGHGDTESKVSPTKIPFFNGIEPLGISGGNRHSLVFDTDGLIYSWGYGGEEYESILTPYDENASQEEIDKRANDMVVVEGFTSMAILQGKLYSWGHNQEGKLGLGLPNGSVVQEPTQVGDFDDWEKVGIETPLYGNACYGLREGKIYTWGSRSLGYLGDGNPNIYGNNATVGHTNVPTQITSFEDWTDIGFGAAIREGKLYTWGYQGENGTLNDLYEPTQLGIDTDWASLGNIGTALKSDGTLFTWGRNANGQTGQGTDSGVTVPPAQVGSFTDWEKAGHGSAIRDGGKLYTWGSNVAGRTGLGLDSGNTLVPTQVVGFDDWEYVSHNTSFTTFAIRDGGKLYVTGTHEYGKSGLGLDSGYIDTFTQVGTDTDWGYAVSSAYLSLYLKNGTLTSSGLNAVYGTSQGTDQGMTLVPTTLVMTDLGYSALGHGDTAQRLTPEQIQYFNDHVIVGISAGFTHSMALDNEGKLYSWGNNDDGQLGLGHQTNSNTPEQIIALDGNFVQGMSAGLNHSAAIDSLGDLYTWGSSEFGQLGHNDLVSHLSPNQVTALSSVNIIEVGSGMHHTLALDENGKVYTWGRNQFGQLGHNDLADRNSPVQVMALDSEVIVQISAGHNHCMAITDTGILYTWGEGANYKLGHPDENDRLVPTVVEALEGWDVTRIEAGGSISTILYEG